MPVISEEHPDELANSAGVFMSSWLGGALLSLGEWFIKKLPIVKHVYSASKQISQALNPSDDAPTFK